MSDLDIIIFFIAGVAIILVSLYVVISMTKDINATIHKCKEIEAWAKKRIGKEKRMRPIDADALIEFCAERWIPLNIDAVNMQPTIQPEKAQHFSEGITKDTISRQAAIDIERNATVDTNPSHFEAHQKFTQFMDDAEVSSFGRWQWANGFNTALTAVGIDLKKLPPIQPEPQWIPVSERLPEKGGEYLVSVHHTIGAISVFHPEKDTYVDDVAIMKYYGKFPSTVRAWMPLSEAYKPNNK